MNRCSGLPSNRGSPASRSARPGATPPPRRAAERTCPVCATRPKCPRRGGCPQHRAPETLHRTVDDEAEVDQVGEVGLGPAPADDPQPGALRPAEANRTAAKNVAVANVDASGPLRQPGHSSFNLAAQLLGDDKIRIEGQDPGGFYRQLVERPLPLGRVVTYGARRDAGCIPADLAVPSGCRNRRRRWGTNPRRSRGNVGCWAPRRGRERPRRGRAPAPQAAAPRVIGRAYAWTMAAATRGQASRARAYAGRRRPSRPASGRTASAAIAVASGPASPARRAAPASRTISAAPTSGVTTTGKPAAIASTTTLPKFSERDGNTRRSEAARVDRSGIVDLSVQRIRPASAGRAARRSSRSQPLVVRAGDCELALREAARARRSVGRAPSST